MLKVLKTFVSFFTVLSLSIPSYADGPSLPSDTFDSMSTEMQGTCHVTKNDGPEIKIPNWDGGQQLNLPGVVTPKLNISSPENFMTNDKTLTSLVFDNAATAAMENIYKKTASSSAAVLAVSAVLEKNGCDGSAPSSIAFSKWGGKKNPNDLSTGINLFPYMPPLSSLDSGPATPEMLDIVENQLSYMGYTQNDVDTTVKNWNNLEYSGGCADAMKKMEAVCSGETTAMSLYLSAKPKNKTNEAAISLAEVGTLAGILFGATKLGLNLHKYKKEQAEKAHAGFLANNNLQLAKEIKVYKDLISSDTVNNLTPATSPELKGATEDFNKSMAELKKAADEGIAFNKEQIEKNTEALLKIDPTYKPPEIDEMPLPFKDAFQNFLEVVWQPYQDRLLATYRKCTDQELNPAAIVVDSTPYELNNLGETCDKDAALQDLLALGSPVQVGVWDKSDAMLGNSAVDKKITEATTHMPVCNPYGDQEYCEKLMDSHMKKYFDGGYDEFCAVSYCPGKAFEEAMGDVSADFPAGF